MVIRGTARIGRRTKELVKRLQPNEIAVIDHQDIDELACQSLLDARVRAVVNTRQSISGRYPNVGPQRLCEAGVYILDEVGPSAIELLEDGDEVEIRGNLLLKGGKVVAAGSVLDKKTVEKKLAETQSRVAELLDDFVQNTLDYARLEKDLILGKFAVPDIGVNIKGRHVLVVVRGRDYKEDLMAIRSYIDEVKPVLIGVDGGADALVELGYRPDIIVGDMDSISDDTLKIGSELVVHAYPDGRAPGLARIRSFGLRGKIFPAPGTSEDIAMLLAYEKGAELIVAVGTHSNMIDFLEKGRPGMASTFLVRLKVGSILVDAKGVNKLYRGRMHASYLLEVAIGALIPLAIIMLVSDTTKQFLRLLLMKVKVVLGLL
ncbi:MAG: hypothetical protein HPY71_04945 [Firmicutes bacterium]|nr:hypothetical protein [Bacillota bacterium]